MRPSSQDLLRLIEATLDDTKAIDPVTIDLQGKTSIADSMVVATGSSSRHIAAMAEQITRRLKDAGIPGLGAEGGQQADWVLIDAGDVIVHLFRGEVRRTYDLEKLWGSTAPEAASLSA